MGLRMYCFRAGFFGVGFTITIFPARGVNFKFSLRREVSMALENPSLFKVASLQMRGSGRFLGWYPKH